MSASPLDLSGDSFKNSFRQAGFSINRNRWYRVRFYQEVLVLTNRDHVQGSNLKRGSRIYGFSNPTYFVPRRARWEIPKRGTYCPIEKCSAEPSTSGSKERPSFDEGVWQEVNQVSRGFGFPGGRSGSLILIYDHGEDCPTYGHRLVIPGGRPARGEKTSVQQKYYSGRCNQETKRDVPTVAVESKMDCKVGERYPFGVS